MQIERMTTTHSLSLVCVKHLAKAIEGDFDLLLILVT